MDTDDISRKDRFEKQLSEFKKDAGLDICGSHIKELNTHTRHAGGALHPPFVHKPNNH